jgi:hypothetical protein
VRDSIVPGEHRVRTSPTLGHPVKSVEWIPTPQAGPRWEVLHMRGDRGEWWRPVDRPSPLSRAKVPSAVQRASRLPRPTPLQSSDFGQGENGAMEKSS